MPAQHLALITRRSFLASSAALAATALLPRWALAADGPVQQAFFTPEENAARRLRQVDSPLIFGDDMMIRNTDFVVGPRFKPSTVTAAIYLPGKRVSIRNSRILTEFRTWDQAWAADPMLCNWVGLRADGAEDLTMDGFHVEGFPHAGVQAYGLRRAQLTRLSGTRCWMPFSFSSFRGGNTNIWLDGLRAWDTWGMGPGVRPGIGGAPSRLRPGGWSGSGGLAGYFTDATLRNLDISGELDGGLKLVHSKRVALSDVRTNRLMIQGTEGRHANSDGSTDGSEAITVRRLVVDKRRGVGDVSDLSNGIQVSFHVTGLDVEDFSLLAGGSDGHGIQLVGDVEASFRKGVISGWNQIVGGAARGLAGPGEPACALEVLDGSKVNDDFEIANRFHRQARIRA